MDCLTPTQPHPIPHGQSLTIEGVLDLTDGGQLGPPVPGFEDAAEDSIPFALLSKDHQYQILLQQAQQNPPIIQEITDSQDHHQKNGLVKTSAQNAEERNSIFLQAQSLATMREIKDAIKKRQAEAEAAYQARVEAERRRLEEAERASRGDASDGDCGSGHQGGEGVKVVTKRKSTTSVAPKPRKRIVRDPVSFMASKPKSTKGLWGRVMSDEELQAEVTEIQQQDQGLQQQHGPQRSVGNFGEEILQETVLKASKVEAMPFIDDGTPEDTGFAAAFEDIVSDEVRVTVDLDDDWTRQSKGWLEDFTKDYTSDPWLVAFGSATADSGLPFESRHLPHIPPSAADVERETSTAYDEPNVFLADDFSSYVTPRRASNSSGTASTRSESLATATAGGRTSKPIITTTHAPSNLNPSLTTYGTKASKSLSAAAAAYATPKYPSASTTTPSRGSSTARGQQVTVDVQPYGEFAEYSQRPNTRNSYTGNTAMGGSSGGDSNKSDSFVPPPFPWNASSTIIRAAGAAPGVGVRGERRSKDGDGSRIGSTTPRPWSRSSISSSSSNSSSSSSSSPRTTPRQASPTRMYPKWR